MPKIYIDNKEYEVKEGKNLLEAIISLGLNLPYFCWHPKLGSVGACRQCAVKQYKDENDKEGKILISCMEAVQDGMRISLEDQGAVDFRSHIIEGLMTNHPHDCPTCDEGGECHLQDMTVMSGHNYRRYRFNKRTFENQYLGPLVNHEMNRCIACYRCVRFYKDYAGGKDLDVLAAHNHVYFGRQQDGVLESEFSGNLVEICPTGVFTDKTLKKHYTRKWDFTSAPSVCNLCSLGCNIIAGERYGEVRRIKARYNYDVNGYFICDRGRFGYEYMNSGKRIRTPAIRDKNHDSLSPADTGRVLDELKDILKNTKTIRGIGSPRASLESNFALRKLVGKENFSSGLPEWEHEITRLAADILKRSPLKKYSLNDVEKSECVLILGEDLTNTAPMMALAVRQAVRQRPMKKAEQLKIHLWNDKAVREVIQTDKGPVYSITSSPTKLDEISKTGIHPEPDEIANLGYAIAHYIDSTSPLPKGLNSEQRDLAKEIARELTASERSAVISGTSSRNTAILRAAFNISKALSAKKKEAGICLTFPEGNSLGLSLLEGKALPSEVGDPKKKEDCLIILENDLYRRMPEKTADRFLDSFRHLIVLDSLESKTSQKAGIVLPAAVITESDGHLVNNEGRIQPFYRVYATDRTIQPGWKWIEALGAMAGNKELADMEKLSDFCSAIEKEENIFHGLAEIASNTGFRIGAQRIPRETHRFSGRTAIHADKSIHEPRPAEDEDSPMTFTMEGFHGHPPAPFNPYFWSPGWNSIQALNKFQIETAGELRRKFPELCLFDQKINGKESMEYYTPDEQKDRKKDAWTFVPLYHIFGSEELSSRNGSVTELVPSPYVAINEETAAIKKWDPETRLKVTLNGTVVTLDIRIMKEIPKNGAGIPIGLNGIPVTELPVKIEIERVT